MDIEQAKLSDEGQDNCTPTDNEIQKHLNDKGILPERIKDPIKRKLAIFAILYGENLCEAQITKLLRLLSEKGAWEEPPLARTQQDPYEASDAWFYRKQGFEKQRTADKDFYKPRIGALKTQVAGLTTQLATARESNTALEKEVERLKKELAWYSKHAGAALSKEGEEK